MLLFVITDAIWVPGGGAKVEATAEKVAEETGWR